MSKFGNLFNGVDSPTATPTQNPNDVWWGFFFLFGTMPIVLVILGMFSGLCFLCYYCSNKYKKKEYEEIEESVSKNENISCVPTRMEVETIDLKEKNTIEMTVLHQYGNIQYERDEDQHGKPKNEFRKYW